MSGQSEATVEDLASSNSISYMTFVLWLVDETRGVEGSFSFIFHSRGNR